VLQKLKSAYISWHDVFRLLPKTNRYTIGQRIDTLLIHAIEAISTASFLPPEKKQSFVQVAIRKIDTVKLLILILWETKALDEKKYIALSLPLDDVGRQLGGWNGQLTKQNSLHTKRREK
jgi:hypothetical protein